MPAGVVASELEAKLLVERAGDLETLARLTRLGPYRLRPRSLQQLYSLYLDSTDLRLARHGVAVRVRRCGDSWEATVKWAGSVHGAVHRRPELTIALSAPPAAPIRLPADLHVHLAAMLAGKKLVPVLVTEIERLPIDVLDASAQGRLAEIALDRVYLHGPRKRDSRRERYFEVEVERKDGSAHDLADITALLRRGRRMRPARESKFSRGLQLLYGAAVPRPPAPVELHRDDPLNVAAREILAFHLGRLIRCDPGTRLGHDPEALHDMRVAIRRLRALVRVFAEAFPTPERSSLRRELRWLGRLLGLVRDIDVQQQRLEAHCRSLRRAQHAAFDPYVDYLCQLRQDRRVAMLEGLDSPRYFRLLRKLEAATSTARVAASGESIAVAGIRAIHKAHARLEKRGARIGKHPSAEDLHELRIRSKHMRYVCEFLRPLTGRPGRRFVGRMVELQDLLGVHNDAEVATSFARRFLGEETIPHAEATRRALGAFIRVNEGHAADSRSQFHHRWEHFMKRQTKRELDAIVDLLS